MRLADIAFDVDRISRELTNTMPPTSPPTTSAASGKTIHPAITPPCTIVIFGASGDLTRRKLLPALYNLLLDGLLPDNFAVLGLGRKDLSDEDFTQNALKRS